jgi:ThiF family
MTDRFDRNIRFFGKEGQARLRAARVAVVGIGGVGTHVVQQLALLGVGDLFLIDDEELDETNRNRYVGVRHDDPIPGTPKVDIGERLAQSMDSEIRTHKVFASVASSEAIGALTKAQYIFGCIDSEGARLMLTELSAAYAVPYIDVASDILPGDRLHYGGRVCVAWNGEGCLVCLEELDLAEAQIDLAGELARKDRDVIYGVERGLLGAGGPSVVSINGIVASYAVTEFMLGITGIRLPNRLLVYRGDLGKVTVNTDPPHADCYYCKGTRGKRAAANLQRFLNSGLAHRRSLNRPRVTPDNFDNFS